MNNNNSNNGQPTLQGAQEEDLEAGVDAIVMEGFRRPRNQTNWMCRGSSMTTADRMNIESMRCEAMDLETVLAGFATAFASITAMASQRLAIGQQAACTGLKRMGDFLFFHCGWLACHIQLIHLDIDDLLIFNHQRRGHPPKRFRTISELPDDNVSEGLFGFKVCQLQLLCQHWRIPPTLRMENRTFAGEEALLIFLCCMRTGIPCARLSESHFGGDPGRHTLHVRSMASHLHENFCHKMTGDSVHLWMNLVPRFGGAIHAKPLDGLVSEMMPDGRVINNWEVYIPCDELRIFGWPDDADMQTDRPRPGRASPDGDGTVDERDTQRAFYNQCFGGHGLKAQVVLPPNGMIGGIFTCSLRHNDNGAQKLSGLNDCLFSMLQPTHQDNDGNQVHPAVCGDAVFAPLATVARPCQQPNHAQKTVNARFSSLREDIEHKFAQVFGLHQTLRHPWCHQLFFNAVHARKPSTCVFFMSNCCTCFGESRNRNHNLRAPTMQEHLPLDEELTPAPPEMPADPNHPEFNWGFELCLARQPTTL